MNCILQDKRKNKIAVCFTAFYLIMLILNTDLHLPFLQNFRYAINSLIIYLIPIITPALVLVFFFTFQKEYSFKKWLFPIAFGVKLISAFFTLYSNFASIGSAISVPKYFLIFLCSCFTFVAIVFVFIGTLSNFEHINLLKYGALSCAVLYFAISIIDFIAVGGFAYLLSVPSGIPAVNLMAFIRILACILFYIGIFILTTNRKNTNLV